METIGQRLEAIRRRRLMTQAALATAAGVSLITVTRLENAGEDANPRPDTVKKLATALDVDPAWLLFGEDDWGKAAPVAA
jgi:transcriptional regulator with XRE-family HTH domain